MDQEGSIVIPIKDMLQKTLYHAACFLQTRRLALFTLYLVVLIKNTGFLGLHFYNSSL